MAITSKEAHDGAAEGPEALGSNGSLAETYTERVEALRLAILEDPLLAHTAVGVLLLNEYDATRERIAAEIRNKELIRLALKRLGVVVEGATATAEEEPDILLTLGQLRSVDRWHHMAARVWHGLETQCAILLSIRQRLAAIDPGSDEGVKLRNGLTGLEVYDVFVDGLISQQAMRRLVSTGTHVGNGFTKRQSSVIEEIAKANFGSYFSRRTTLV